MRGTILITALCFLSIICFGQDPGPTGSAFSNPCFTTGDVTWTNPGTTNTILVFAKSGSTAITVGTPTNNISTYTANAAFGSGTAYQNDAAAFCVYKGTGTSLSLTALSAGTTYQFIIFNATGTTYSTASAFSGSTISTPANATGLSAVAGTNSATVSWTDPATCFSEIMIVAKQGSSVSGTPSGNGSSYTDNSLSFTDGSNTAFGGGVVVYKGSSSPQTVTNLTTGQTYFFKVFTRRGTTWSAGVETSVTICTTPDSATALKISDTNTTATLYWTDPACFDEIMIVTRQGSLATGTPSGNGSAYTANSLSFTDGANTSFGGGVVVFKGTGGQSPKTITNLTNGNIYYFTIFTRKGTLWSAGASISTATGNPLILSVDPTDGSTGVSSNQVFTITFNENIFIATGSSGAATQVTFNQSGTDPVIPRGSTSGTTTGDGYITRNGNIVTLTLSSDLDLNELNNILIGTNVFRDSSSNNFAGTVSGDWNFTTSSGISLNNPSVGACINQYTTLPSIDIVETSNNNVTGTDNGSYTLILGLDQSGFIFKPGTTGVTATADPGGDIQSITVNSISFTQASFTIQFKNVSNDGQANDDHDEITISGLKVSMDGSSPPPANVQVKAASTITIQGVTEDTTPLANITAGSTPSAPTISWPSGDNSYCSGTDLTTITVTASGGTSYNWYNDAALTSVLFTNNTTRTAAQLFGASPGTGTFTKYATSVNGCESTATPVILQITALPTADAGGVQTVCPADEITIGGTPTANGGAGSYTYVWTSSPAGFSSSASNPTFNAPANATASNAIINYAVTVKDGNLCSATDNVNITVKTISENVIITQPNTYTYTTSNQPINLVGSPAGGTFSGVGVVQLNGSYKFDPQSAGIGTWPITYTATLANGCVKSFTQNFDVTTPYDIFAALQTQYCNNEAPVALSINPTAVAQIQNFINTWNTVYVVLYGYSPLKPTFTGIIRNEYETYYGDNNSVQPTGGTYVSGGVTLNQYNFYPSAFTTDQAYPAAGGTSGACATCTYGYVAVFLEFVSPLLTSPYNVPVGTDRGYVYNIGGVAAIEYGGEFPTINPVPVASFSGLLPSYCNINTNYDLTGNKVGGSFEISNNGSTYGDIVGDGIKDVTEGIAPGIGEFNPQAAFGGATASTTKYIRYSVDPGTTGSTSQGCIGRQVNSTIIYPSTSITWDASVPVNNTQFCYEGAAIDLKTSQGSPPSSGSVAFSGFGVADSGNGLAKFTPQTAFDAKDPNSTVSQTITVTAIYTNTQGCAYPLNRDFVVRVKPTSSFTVTDPTIPGTPTDFNFCYNDSPVNLQGNQPASSTLKYTIDYLTLGYTKTINSDHFTFSPQIYYNDAVAKGGSNVSDANFNVQYIVSDAIGCTASFTKLFAVSPIATITISGINDGDKFCSNEKVFPISFAPINGALDINGVLISSNQSTSINSTDLPIGNSISISYTYKSGVSQCVSNTTYTVSQIKAPKADFTTNPVCNEQPATFAATPDPANYSWTWVLGDSIRSGTDKQTINQVFPGLSTGATQTSYIIRLIVENNPAALLVCRDSAEHTQVIGAYPKVSFDNVNVCENDFTRFSITNNIPITTAEWDFGDTYTLPIKAINTTIVAPDTHGGRTTNKYGNPYHQFVFTPGQPNEYLVQLTARTDDNLGACADTAIKRVAILEKIAPTPLNPYTMSNLNGGDGLWLTEDIADSSTWVFDNPVGKFDNTNGKVWITNASGIYKAKDNSYVNSPCFDLSAFNKPVLQLKYWNKTDLAKDGAVVQYSINGGANWATLGSQLSGLNWYSSTSISSAPGNFSQYGWTGQQQDSWLIGKNSLNEIPGAHNNVRFRIAFASDEREEYEGFAFNNVIIEERNRIALVEHFTNDGAPGSAASVNNFLNDPAMNTSEVVRLEYHTNSPNQDAINAQNQTDNNARAAYYGVSTNTVPIGFIDGTRNGVLDFQTNWFNAALAKRSLNSSPFEIDINTIPSAKPNQITVIAKVTKIGLLGVLNPKPIMHVVIIEKSVGTDGFIMRKFLPSASGTALVTTPSIPTVTTDTLAWNVENIADLSQLAVIVFIQDEGTGEVYQSSILANPTDLPTVITGAEMPLSDQINIYPSPANKSVIIQLPKVVSESTPVKMFDVSGHEVHNSVFKTGEMKKTINSQDFAAGVYLIQIETAGTIVRKKLVVMHELD